MGELRNVPIQQSITAKISKLLCLDGLKCDTVTSKNALTPEKEGLFNITSFSPMMLKELITSTTQSLLLMSHCQNGLLLLAKQWRKYKTIAGMLLLIQKQEKFAQKYQNLILQHFCSNVWKT